MRIRADEVIKCSSSGGSSNRRWQRFGREGDLEPQHSKWFRQQEAGGFDSHFGPARSCVESLHWPAGLKTQLLMTELMDERCHYKKKEKKSP